MFYSRREGNRISDNRFSYNLIIIASMFLAYVSSIFVGSSLLFFIKIPITGFNFIVFPIIAMVLGKFILDKDGERLDWKFFLITLVSFFVLVGILAGINNFIWDSSYDSLGYHQDTIIKLYEGWNPFYSFRENINLWVMHYAKASPIFATALYKLTGRIESAKVLTTLIPIILFMLSYGVFNLVTRNKKKISCLAAVMLALNPVILEQLFSYYVDSILGIYITVLIIVLYLIVFYKDMHFFKYFTLVNVAVFLINIKFTGLAYAIFILIGFLVINFIYNEKKYNVKLIGFLIGGFIFSVVIVGFNPYVTNTITNKNPLYPLAGEGKVDIMTTNTPENFRYDNGFEQAFKALVATPSVNNQNGNLPKNIGEVFKIDGSVLYSYSLTDPRIRGFGIYSLIFLPLSFIAFVYLLAKHRHTNKKLVVSTIIITLAVVFTMIYGGDFWWARYVPYLWTIPVMVALIFTIDSNRNMRRVGKGLFALLIFNCFLIGVMSIGGKIYRSQDLKAYIFKEPLVIKQGVFSNSYENKAREYKIKYTIEK